MAPVVGTVSIVRGVCNIHIHVYVHIYMYIYTVLEPSGKRGYGMRLAMRARCALYPHGRVLQEKSLFPATVVRCARRVTMNGAIPR